MSDTVSIPEHVSGAPFQGYSYALARTGAVAYRRGVLLSDCPYIPGVFEGEDFYSSWRYGWLLEQQNVEGRMARDWREADDDHPTGVVAVLTVFSVGSFFFGMLGGVCLMLWLMSS